MPGIALANVDTAGGVQLGGGQSKLKVGGNLAVVLGDPVAGHGLMQHAGPVMATASSKFFIQGKPVCRAGDLASCGHATTGSGKFSIP